MIRKAAPQIGALVLVLLACWMVSPGFFRLGIVEGRLTGSLIDILNRGAPVALLALGMAPVIATRGIDLSVGATMAIAGAVAAVSAEAGYAWWQAVGFALAAGLAAGLWNGVLVAFLAIQPIVATLVLMVAGRGIAQLITEGRIVTFTDPALAAIGSGRFLWLPVPVWLALGAVVALTLLLRRTALGLFIEAVGVNPRASHYAGIGTRGLLLAVYANAGLMAAIAGVIVAADIRGADANNAGLWLELDAILAVVLGGASLFGGRLSFVFTVIGALTLQALKTGILLAGFPPEFNLVAMAGVVTVLLVLQAPPVRQRLARA
jgi:ribose/xylose/arabinose/galactoside ABC-type transport system permease subunit